MRSRPPTTTAFSRSGSRFSSRPSRARWRSARRTASRSSPPEPADYTWLIKRAAGGRIGAPPAAYHLVQAVLATTRGRERHGPARGRARTAVHRRPGRRDARGQAGVPAPGGRTPGGVPAPLSRQPAPLYTLRDPGHPAGRDDDGRGHDAAGHPPHHRPGAAARRGHQAARRRHQAARRTGPPPGRAAPQRPAVTEPTAGPAAVTRITARERPRQAARAPAARPRARPAAGA